MHYITNGSILYTTKGEARGKPQEQKGSEMFDYSEIKNQVTDYMGEFEGDYDVDAIMDELRAIEPDVQSIDEVEDFDDILVRHDVSGK